jgi:hypothetical protein
VKPNARPVVLGFAMLATLVVTVASCDDDSTGPRQTVTYTLDRAPSPIKDGWLVLEYSGSDRGRVWYGFKQPDVTDFGTFRMRGSKGVDLQLRVGGRSGDFDSRRRVLKLNDGTRWKRID